MSLSIFNGLTSQTVDLFIADTGSTTGGGKTGLVYNTSGLSAWYRKGATGTLTQITLATQTVGGAWSSGGFVEIDSANGPGLYRLDLPNAAVDTSGFTTVSLNGTGVVMAPIRVDCRPVNTVTNVTTVNGLAADTITAGSIATDAIGSNEISAAAVTKIQTGLATPTNITAGTITTVTNLTNAPTNGDLTATMKASVTTAATAATPTPSDAAATASALSAINAKTTNLPSDPADQSLVEAAIASYTSGLASQSSVNTLIGYVDTEVAAIKAKTDNLPSDPADQSLLEAAITAATSPLATSAGLTSVAAVTTKLDTALVLDGSVYQFTANALENAPASGGGSVIVYPLNASMPLKSVGLLMTFYTEEQGVVVGPIGVTARSGNTIVPVDLSGRTLEVRFIDYLGTEILSIPDSDITISGADDDQFSFVVTTALTETPTVCHEDQYHYWTLRDITDGENVLLAGRARVLLS